MNKVYNLGDNMELLDKKYHGCGNGYVTVDKDEKVIDFGYLDEDDKELEGQNINMADKAGELMREDADGSKTYRCNFSCTQACLF